MTNDEAKFMLRAYRPNGRDADDKVLAGAFRQARSDPALAAWFAREQAHDAAVAAKLAQIGPPPGLRDAILAGARASSARTGTRRWVIWLAVAAGVAVMASLAVRRSTATLAANELTQLALLDARELTPHHGGGEPAMRLRSMLTASTGKLPESLPVDFRSLAKTGCRTLSLSGETVLEVCFNHQGTWLHLYVVRCKDFPRMPAQQAPSFAAEGAMQAVTWADGVFRYVVAGPVSREVLQKML